MESNSLLDDLELLTILKQHDTISDKQFQFIRNNLKKLKASVRSEKKDDEAFMKSPLNAGFPTILDVLVNVAKLQVDEEQVFRTLGKHFSIPFKKLDPLKLDLKFVTTTISKQFALYQRLLPFGELNDEVQVALLDPRQADNLYDVEKTHRIQIKPYLTTQTDLQRIMTEFFGFQHSITQAETHFGSELANGATDLGNLEQNTDLLDQNLLQTEQHISAAVNHLLLAALDQRASDIHIEPKRDICEIRLRIDGDLHTTHTLPGTVHSAIVSRLKTMSRLDIAVKRKPQDGRLKLSRSDGEEVEVRISTLPVAFGEKVVMRLLDRSFMIKPLEDLGFESTQLRTFRELASASTGLFLVTGPTGSGKSTTLYSTLTTIASSTKNIITVEDPIEMICPEFNQVSAQDRSQVTFATALKSILRQDPDIIMIGEIRDAETVTHAIQAALTGHLVLSTLHTNDSTSAVSRLIDLQAQSFLISSTLIGVLAQRLVKRVCVHCKTEVIVPTQELQAAQLNVNNALSEYRLQHGAGCEVCRKTGYHGRVGIFEIFPVSDDGREMIANSSSTAKDLRALALREGMVSLREDAWKKSQAGLTTYQEVLRTTETN